MIMVVDLVNPNKNGKSSDIKVQTAICRSSHKKNVALESMMGWILWRTTCTTSRRK